MNTLHFKYAVEIEKTRSITQAAENLYMAQPNLSKAIKELENSLGITIFRRTSKGVIPTDQGMKFLTCAKQILMQIDNMEAIASPDKPKERKMRISVPRAGYISKALSEFIAASDASDDMEVYFCETNSLRTIENVRDNGYNFGIIRFNAAHEKYFMDFLAEKNLECQLLWEYQALAVMSAEHPAAEKEELTYAELSAHYAELAQEMGIDKKNVKILKCGEVLEIGEEFFDVVDKETGLSDDGQVLAITTNYMCNEWLDESDAVRCMTDTPTSLRVSADLISLMFFFLEWHDVMTSARSTPQRYLFMGLELHYFNPDVVISREHFLIEPFEALLG